MIDRALGWAALGLSLIGLVFPVVFARVGKRFGWSVFASGVVCILWGTHTAFLPEERQEPASATLGLPSGSGGNYSIAQQGGYVYQTYINQAPPKRQFDDDFQKLLLAQVPKDKPLELWAVGSTGDQMIGQQAAAFLREQGYKVKLRLISTLMPPPVKSFTMDKSGSQTILVLAPGIQ